MIRHESDYYLMRGAGIGSIFSNIFRGLVPILGKLITVGKQSAKSEIGKSVIKAAKRSALDAGLNIAHDTLKGKKLKDVGKENAKRIGTNFVKNLEHELKKGKGIKRKKAGGSLKSRKRKKAGGSLKSKTLGKGCKLKTGGKNKKSKRKKQGSYNKRIKKKMKTNKMSKSKKTLLKNWGIH